MAGSGLNVEIVLEPDEDAVAKAYAEQVVMGSRHTVVLIAGDHTLTAIGTSLERVLAYVRRVEERAGYLI